MGKHAHGGTGLPRPEVSVCRIYKDETKRLRRRDNVNKEAHLGPSIEGKRAR